MQLSLDHVHVRCQDPEAALAFYVNVMGGQEVGRSESLGMPIFRVEVGGAVLSLSPKRQGDQVLPLGGLHYGAYQIGFTVPDLSKAVAEFKSKGIELKRGPVDVRPGLRVAFVQAPDDVEIELMELS